MLVKDVMTKDVITVHPEMSLKDAGKIFKEKRVSGLPVLDDDGDLVGIVTLTDMLKVLNDIYEWRKQEQKWSGLNVSKEFEQKKSEGTVKDIMSNEVYTLEEDATMEDVMRSMFAKQKHTLPITKDNKLVGIIGKHDLISFCF